MSPHLTRVTWKQFLNMPAIIEVQFKNRPVKIQVNNFSIIPQSVGETDLNDSGVRLVIGVQMGTVLHTVMNTVFPIIVRMRVIGKIVRHVERYAKFNVVGCPVPADVYQLQCGEFQTGNANVADFRIFPLPCGGTEFPF
ncbi:hypothetical protein [Klebsiella oxytoca]|uniref:hypothetical protein n=1 Tax=Klebsiella oxytoca TaxID=571 RepID=UPI003878FA93